MYDHYDDAVRYPDAVSGVVRRVSKPDFEGWVRGAVTDKTTRRPVYFAGPLVGIDVGMDVELQGERETDSRFSAFSYTTTRSELVALQQLLVAKVKGVGPAKAKRFTEDVPLGLALDALYSDTWYAHLGVRDTNFPLPEREGLESLLYMYMLGYPVSTLLPIYAKHGKTASVRPRTAPYAYAIEGTVPFHIEDLVQKKLGCCDEEMRITAAGAELSRWIRSDMDGHTMYSLNTLAEKLAKIIKSTHSDAVRYFKNYLANQSFYPVRGEWSPAELATAEVAVAARVFAAANETPLEAPTSFDYGNLDEIQRGAVEMAFSSKFSVLTGGPGTGKTTTVRAIVRAAIEHNYNVRLLAPTGKAARRLSEVARLGSSTIHRYLPIDWRRTDKVVLRDDAPECADDIVIIDECSMVDSEIMGVLLRYCEKAQIVCVGDADQLPSVSPGSVLQDLLNGYLVKSTRLTRVHRSAQSSWMAVHAPKILRGEIDLSSTNDFRFLPLSNTADLVPFLVERIQKNAGNDYQILSPRRTGPFGTEALNGKIQRSLHDQSEPRTTYNDITFYVNDPVVCSTTDYQNGVYNGDIGKVTSITDNSATVVYKFFDKEVVVTYTGNELSMLQPAYVLSVHKYQGSEARKVTVVCHSQMGPTILTNKLLYTAVTRAREDLEIVGDKLGVRMAASTQTPPRRTALSLFLENSSDWPTQARETLL